MIEIEIEEIPLDGLIGLCHHRWALPVVGMLWAARGGKFVAMVRGLGVGRESLSRTLSWLVASDLVMKNPGRGHPMRPEYLLTPFGEMLGGAAADVLERAAGLGADDVCARKWSLPVLAAMGMGKAERFGELRGALAGVTPRALAQALEALEGAGLVERRVSGGRPLGTLYVVERRGQGLADAAGELARAAAWR